ncbi:hypothetical protein CRG98_029533 [Punica granatum]|uniref:Uncharacterized protein n=1 Tax=Punica granatum TaxID=22663 RepID=A0A2I0J1H6_PUNGR|nr:hypothetical protein CRG98_029533 [Punica granatum]
MDSHVRPRTNGFRSSAPVIVGRALIPWGSNFHPSLGVETSGCGGSKSGTKYERHMRQPVSMHQGLNIHLWKVLKWGHVIGVGIFIVGHNFTIVSHHHDPLVWVLTCYASPALAFKTLNVTIPRGRSVDFTLRIVAGCFLLLLDFRL